MILYKDNLLLNAQYMDDEIILQKFVESDIYKRKDFLIDTRLALFISYTEPEGLQSIFDFAEFKQLLEMFFINKHKFVKF